MKISLKNIEKDQTVSFSEKIDPEELDLDIGVMHFPENLTLKAEVFKSGTDLNVDVHIEGERVFTCSLCLEDFNNLFEKDFTLHYDIKGLETVVVDPDVRDEILTESPVRILCRQDCRGLCPFCGSNLNHEKCNCKETE
jgi:uncharacterized protein